MEFRGIDVSEFQGAVNFEQVKSGDIDFVMIRTGFGKNPSQYDKCMRANADGAAQAGIPYGFYHYSYALTPADAAAEADFALELAAGYSPTMPFAYDVEDLSQKGLTPEELSAVADAFLSKIKAAGYYPMLYSNLSWLSARFTPELLVKYDVWLAQWAGEPSFGGEFGIWQYTSSGRVPGIDVSVDLDVAYKDYPAIIADMDSPEPVLDNTPSDYAKSAVDKALALGILKGNEYGDLMLHSPLLRQDFFVLMDRLGLLDK